MTLWIAILLACAATYLTKLAGYAVPARWLQNPRMTRVAGAITVALLSALTVMNTFAAGTALVIDARLAALGVAALALWLRLPFLLVVVLGAGWRCRGGLPGPAVAAPATARTCGAGGAVRRGYRPGRATAAARPAHFAGRRGRRRLGLAGA